MITGSNVPSISTLLKESQKLLMVTEVTFHLFPLKESQKRQGCHDLKKLHGQEDRQS